MGSINLVVPVGADQHQMSHVRPGQQILNQIERCRVEPLQIVEEHGQRVFPCEYADESTEHQLEAALRILPRKLRNRWLFSYDQLQLGNQIHNELSVRIQRFTKGISPLSQFFFVLAQQRTDEA